MAWRILALDADPRSRRPIVESLGARGFRVEATAISADFLRRLERSGADLIIVDIGTPDGDGLEFLNRLCARWNGPLIAIEAARDDYGCIAALELGADDYIRRPFDAMELVARVRALHRRLTRSGVAPVPVYRFLGCTYVVDRRELIAANGDRQRLTRGEDCLLQVFIRSPNTRMHRDRLLQRMHGDVAASDRSVDIMVSRLRSKLARVTGGVTTIRTERGEGYLFLAEVQPGVASQE